MKTSTKSLWAVSALLTAALTAGTVMARDDAAPGDREPCNGPRYEEHHGFHDGGHHGGKWGRDFPRKQEMMEREYSADQIRTLMEARLIRKGNDNLKVGDIKPTDKGYTVAIVTKDNSLVEELDVAKNGMPQEMYEHIQERMKAREEK